MMGLRACELIDYKKIEWILYYDYKTKYHSIFIIALTDDDII